MNAFHNYGNVGHQVLYSLSNDNSKVHTILTLQIEHIHIFLATAE